MSGPNITIRNFDDGGHALTLPSSRLTSYDDVIARAFMGLMTSAETFTAHLHYAQGDCTLLPSITKRDWESGRFFAGVEPRTFFVHFKRKVGAQAWSKAPRAINPARASETAPGSVSRGGRDRDERRTERQQDSTAVAEPRGGRDPGREKKRNERQKDATIISPEERTGSYYRPRYEVDQSRIFISPPLPELTVQKYPMTTRGHVRPPRLIRYNEPEELVSVARYTSQGVYRDEVLVPRSMLPVDDPRARVSGRDGERERRERERMEAVEAETWERERERDKQQKEREKQERKIAREARRLQAQEEEAQRTAVVRRRVDREIRNENDLPLFVRSTSPIDEQQQRDESLPLFVRSTSPIENPHPPTSNPSLHIPSTPRAETSYNDVSGVSLGRRNAPTRSPQRDADFSFTARPVFPPQYPSPSPQPPVQPAGPFTPLTSVFQPPTIRPVEEIQSDVERLRRLLDAAHEEERGNQERWARERQRQRQQGEIGGGRDVGDEEEEGEEGEEGEEEKENADGEWRWSGGFEMLKSVGGEGKGKGKK